MQEKSSRTWHVAYRPKHDRSLDGDGEEACFLQPSLRTSANNGRSYEAKES